MVQVGTAGRGTQQGPEDELNHPSGFLEARTQGLAGAAGNSATYKAFLGPEEGSVWGDNRETRNPYFFPSYLVMALKYLM